MSAEGFVGECLHHNPNMGSTQVFTNKRSDK